MAITPYLLLDEFEEHLDNRAWTGKRAWRCDWSARHTVAPKLGDDWPELTAEDGDAYMKCIRVHFLPYRLSGPAADELAPSAETGTTVGGGDTPPECKVVAEYSSRELEEDLVSMRGKVDVLECGLGDTFTPLDGSGAIKFNYKTAKLFPYEEFRVTKVFGSASGPETVADDTKNAVGRVNDATFEIYSKFITGAPTTAQKWSFTAGQCLLIGIDVDTWELEQPNAIYADVEPRYRATYIFGVRAGTNVHPGTGNTPITWNHIYRPRVFDKHASGHVKHETGSGTKEEAYSATAGKWGTLTPPLYEEADFSSLWGL